MNKKIFAALASATMALSATGSLAVFAEDFDVVTEADGTNGTVSGVTIPSTGVVVDEKNFPDKDFRDALINWGATLPDNKGQFAYGDKLTKAELESVTYLHVPAGAKNLDGVKYFVNLTNIDNYALNPGESMTATDLQWLDVRTRTNGLVSADLTNNAKLKTINFVDESELTTLLVPEGNTLSSVTVKGQKTANDGAPLAVLDLSKNKLLNDVNIEYTEVAALDLSNNPYLTNVNVSNNKINTLDLTNNYALVLVQAAFNELYNLDVPNTNKLTDLVLEGNTLQEIDLTGLTGLISLNLKNNELKTLDLSPVEGTLKNLGVGFNHLGYLDASGIKSFGWAEVSPQIVYLDTAYNGVNLKENFEGFDSHEVVDTDIFDKKTGVLTVDGSEATYQYKVNKDLSEMDVTVKKESVMNRLYNPNSGEHFYTSDIEEKDALVKLGWKDEGIGWTAPSTSTGNAPVYRLYNPNAGDHHYTVSSSERDILVSVGWKYEGIGWYSYNNAQTVNTPNGVKNIPAVNVLREYNPNAKAAGAHNYTVNHAENDFLVSVGWLDEGVAWQAMK